MADASDQTIAIQDRLDRLRAGDPAAREELIAIAAGRLTRLARRMLRDNPRIRRWEETDDVLQNATLQLYRALATVRPESVRDFFKLAAAQIRRELIDLARHHYGPLGPAAHYESRAGADGDSSGGPTSPQDPADESHEPGRLASWTEFHRCVEVLPDEEREVFHLLWYHELTQAEAAQLLGTSERVVGSLWRRARYRLHRALGGARPGT
jgi:RNA polymerase sigma-70 factor (ECF subfamily)